MHSDIHRAIDAVWRIESAGIIASITRMTGELGLAEEIVQEALVAALEKWPETGIPENPGAWLTTVARNRALDLFRRDKRLREKQEILGRETETEQAPEIAPHMDAKDFDAGENLLGLMFLVCNPVLSRDARTALTLRILGGLTAGEIARAFVISESAVTRRISRAKNTLREARVPFVVPEGRELSERLPSLLEIIYLIFNEGYSATSGSDWTRPGLCEEALRLGRILAALVPREAEAHGLTALMEFQASRLRARRGPDGEPVLLLDQNRARWDYMLIGRGFEALKKAEELGGPSGPYTLQAAIASCHARARSPEEIDWPRIAALYEALAQTAGSPVVELNRAVAISMAYGPAAGLEIIDELMAEEALRGYHLLPTVRGDFLFKLGRLLEAAEEFKKAASMTQNAVERELLLSRARDCDKNPEDVN